MDANAVVAGLSLVTWANLLLARGRFWKADCLDDAPVAMPAEWPAVSVVIPARNEADMLPQSLPSLLKNNYPGPFKIVLIDDRSEDGTAAEAERIARDCNATERLTVINGRALPAGWKGKVWAMQTGFDHIAAQAEQPRYVLFTDADIAYEPDAITRLVARAEESQNVLTTLMVLLRCKSAAERFLIPAFVYFFQMLYPFRWVNNPRRKTAGAAGGCMLTRYDALTKAGGLKPIRGALIDDCAMGRMMKGQGKIWLGLTQSVHSLREYPEFDDIRTMVARTAYDQLNYSPLKLAGCVAGMALTYLAPVMMALFATGTAQACGIAAWLLMAFSCLPILRFYKQPLWWAVALPLVAVSYMGFTLDSAWQYANGRGGYWKGRAQAGQVQEA